MPIVNIPGAVNPSSIAENSTFLQFPKSIASEIPLYLKFYCVEYGQTPLRRAGFVGGPIPSGGIKTVIAVPAPLKLVNQTAMRYKQEEANIPGSQIINDRIKQYSDYEKAQNSLPPLAGLAAAGGRAIARTLLAFAIKSPLKALSQLIESDFNETVLQSGSKRSFQITLYLPCLTIADSIAAAKIAKAFEAYALPTAIGVSPFGIFGSGLQAQFHPPMWFFGIGPLGSIKNDEDWTSQPQVSVLTNVAVSRSAIDSSSFAAITDEIVKPIAYSITLNFVEIEAAMRSTDITNFGGDSSTTIVNRSRALFLGSGGLGSGGGAAQGGTP